MPNHPEPRRNCPPIPAHPACRRRTVPCGPTSRSSSSRGSGPRTARRAARLDPREQLVAAQPPGRSRARRSAPSSRPSRAPGRSSATGPARDPLAVERRVLARVVEQQLQPLPAHARELRLRQALLRREPLRLAEPRAEPGHAARWYPSLIACLLSISSSSRWAIRTPSVSSTTSGCVRRSSAKPICIAPAATASGSAASGSSTPRSAATRSSAPATGPARAGGSPRSDRAAPGGGSRAPRTRRTPPATRRRDRAAHRVGRDPVEPADGSSASSSTICASSRRRAARRRRRTGPPWTRSSSRPRPSCSPPTPRSGRATWRGSRLPRSSGRRPRSGRRGSAHDARRGLADALPYRRYSNTDGI